MFSAGQLKKEQQCEGDLDPPLDPSWGLPVGKAGEGEAEGMQEKGTREAGGEGLIKHEWKVGDN